MAMVYQAVHTDPVAGVAVVECEAWFNPKALHLNWNREHTQVTSTDWGFWQLNSAWHPQFRDDLAAHARYGGGNFDRTLLEQRGELRSAIAAYNTGNPRSGAGLSWADHVLAVYAQLQQMTGVWGFR